MQNAFLNNKTVKFWKNAVTNKWFKTEFATTKVILRKRFIQTAFLQQEMVKIWQNKSLKKKW